MRPWWQRAAVALAVLLLLSLVLLGRHLDAGLMYRTLRLELEPKLHAVIRSDPPHLSFVNGVGLRLRNVDVKAVDASWRLHADTLRLRLSLWALLWNKAEITVVDMVHPTLRLARPFRMRKLLPSFPTMKWPDLRLAGGRILLAGVPFTENMTAAVRRLDRGRTLSWEAQARVRGGDLSMQGRIRKGLGGPHLFGRLTVTHIRLPSKWRVHPLSPAYAFLDAGLTFDMRPARRWQLSGEASLFGDDKRLPRISWRGKVEGRSLQRFRLLDTFLHLGPHTAATLAGGCAKTNGCRLTVDAKGAEIGTLLAATGIQARIGGHADIHAVLLRRRRDWHINAAASVHRLVWRGIRTPDLMLSLGDLLYHPGGAFSIEKAHLRPAAGRGRIVLRHLEHRDGRWRFSLKIEKLETVWAPLAAMLLRMHGLPPALKGKGPMDARLEGVHSGRRMAMTFFVDAGGAAIRYGGDFSKPAGIAALASGKLEARGRNIRILLKRTVLADNRIVLGRWSGLRDSGELTVEEMHLDLDGLRRRGVRLPAVVKAWHGGIDGGLRRVHPRRGWNGLQWLAHADADLELYDFGRGAQAWTGKVHIRDGRLHTQAFEWREGRQHARFDGVVELPLLHGRLNVHDVFLRWPQEKGVPEWFKGAKLHGRIRGARLEWLGNTWEDISAGYRLVDARLSLVHVHARLAGGALAAPRITLVPTASGVRFSARVRMAARLERIAGLNPTLGANLKGLAFLNADLSGVLPWQAGAQWYGNGDIEIRRGLWRPQAPEMVLMLGKQRRAGNKSHAFSLFSTRFRLRRQRLLLTRLVVIAGGRHLAGRAVVLADGRLSGRLKATSGKGLPMPLLGRWPALEKLFGNRPSAGD